MEQTRLTTIEKVIFLKSVDIFEHAPIEELGRVAALMEEAQFEAEETIYREGEPLEAIYIILKGRVAVQSNGKVIREMGEKRAVGTLSALDFNSALRTVKAIEPIHALKLQVQDFQDILSLDFELVKAVFRVVAQQIRTGEW
jgi:CRP-like cAMP-binding protein